MELEMRKSIFSLLVICLSAALAAGTVGGGEKTKLAGKSISERLKAYAPVEIKVPWRLLDEKETAALEKLYQAARVMDEIFLRQVSADNPALRKKLEAEGDAELLRFFKINFGPWDRLEGHQPFIGEAEKPAGADFYPADMTREEFEKWIREHPGDRESFESNFTVIRRSPEGGLRTVPYSSQYGKLLKKAAGFMEEAAALTGNESLAEFLRLRAAAFFTDDYFQSDMAWMDIKDNVIDITLGPYEVYEDNIFNYKAAFETFLCVRDPEESRRLEGLKSYLVKMERNLPLEDKYKNLERGTDSPISVVDVVFSAGDTKAGVQTLAFNLPNDERVREAKGCKKVMLRNICHAKFDKILLPIAQALIAENQRGYVTFDSYFNHILLHEFSHGLGPGKIVLADGTETTVNKILSNTYSAIEEAKADVVGEYNFYYLIDEGFYDRGFEKEAAVTFLAGFFRSVRFGVDEAHGRANMIIFNYMKEKGIYRLDDETGRWSVDFARVREAVRDLSQEILMIQARGDYEGAREFIEQYGEMGDDVARALAKLGGVPVDIEPHFEIEEKFAVN
ncbi:MAG: peptidase [Candidatus Krumholzibacteriota bacterium]|nr:peptidase [Candidatus Krumholzibacteriota bacterium]